MRQGSKRPCRVHRHACSARLRRRRSVFDVQDDMVSRTPSPRPPRLWIASEPCATRRERGRGGGRSQGCGEDLVEEWPARGRRFRSRRRDHGACRCDECGWGASPRPRTVSALRGDTRRRNKPSGRPGAAVRHAGPRPRQRPGSVGSDDSADDRCLGNGRSTTARWISTSVASPSSPRRGVAAHPRPRRMTVARAKPEQARERGARERRVRGVGDEKRAARHRGWRA